MASLVVALAWEATRLFGRRKSKPGDSQPQSIQGQSTSCSYGGESKGSGRPRLCALRGGNSAKATRDQGAENEELQQKQKNKNEQEAKESTASGRTQGSEEGSGLNVEFETASARNGIWGRTQLRLRWRDREHRLSGWWYFIIVIAGGKGLGRG